MHMHTQEWKEVLELTPLILQKLYSAIEPGPHDYCVIVDAQQQTYYLNKRTGTTTTEPPPGFVEAAAAAACKTEEAPAAPADSTTTDVDSTGVQAPAAVG